MTWDKTTWDRHLHNVRSALHKRDILLNGGCRPGRRTGDGDQECRAWAAKARANLSRLTQLARAAPDAEAAWALVQELRDWHQFPGKRPRAGAGQKVDRNTRVRDYHGKEEPSCR